MSDNLLPTIAEQVKAKRDHWTFILRMSDLTTHYFYARGVTKDGEPEDISYEDAFLQLAHQVQTHRVLQVGDTRRTRRTLTDLHYVCGAQVVSFELAGGHD